MLNRFKNKLLVFEGEDHCGKSTVARLFVEHLNKNNISTIFTFQPGDKAYGNHAEIMDELCTGKVYSLDPLSNLFAFLLDRSEHTIKVVAPALESGKTVVADRWWYSTIAYQFFGKQLLSKYNLNEEFAYWMNKLASHFVEPDVVFYFRREQSKIDSTKNDNKDLFESETDAFKRRVKEAYQKMIRFDPHFIVINVDDDAQTTLERVLEVKC
jgi:dTMP kinase